jgi:repressor LexA
MPLSGVISGFSSGVFPLASTIANGCSQYNPIYEHLFSEQVFDFRGERAYALNMSPNTDPTPINAAQAKNSTLTERQRGILDFIVSNMRERGYPPSVREIGEAVGLSSSATVHNHLAALQKLGYLRRDPTKPRAIEVRYEASSGVAMEHRPTKHVPLVGDVAAGVNVLAQENVEELVPLPMDFTGDGELFMLRVRGDSMIDAGILNGDFVVCNSQSTANNGDIVIAGIPGDEATIKTFSRNGSRITLTPSNTSMKPMIFDSNEVVIYGRLVTVLRRL